MLHEWERHARLRDRLIAKLKLQEENRPLVEARYKAKLLADKKRRRLARYNKRRRQKRAELRGKCPARPASPAVKRRRQNAKHQAYEQRQALVRQRAAAPYGVPPLPY